MPLSKINPRHGPTPCRGAGPYAACLLLLRLGPFHALSVVLNTCQNLSSEGLLCWRTDNSVIFDTQACWVSLAGTSSCGRRKEEVYCNRLMYCSDSMSAEKSLPWKFTTLQFLKTKLSKVFSYRTDTGMKWSKFSALRSNREFFFSNSEKKLCLLEVQFFRQKCIFLKKN